MMGTRNDVTGDDGTDNDGTGDGRKAADWARDGTNDGGRMMLQ